ncbi:MAG: transporter substrate-binding protein [Betaproteobacteria bacterium]|nr:transporter substrate-binding protein [Betaproteobacteria bacterium]
MSNSLNAAIPIALTIALGSAHAQAQQYASKPVRIIVPYTPGGGVDIMGRLAALKYGERFGVQFLVENRAGGGTVIGTEAVARAAPDGYTLLFTNNALSATPALNDKLPFDPVQSFAPVGHFASSYNVLAVHPSLPVKSVKELVALARAKPAQLNYASAGNGSAIHLAMVMFESAAGIELVHIPYKGAAPALIDVIGGQITIMFTSAPAALEPLLAGRVRALGVSSVKRLAVLPNVPTIGESGYPGFEVNNWLGMVAPAQTPPEIVARLNSEMNAILALPEVKDRIAAHGNDPAGGAPDVMGDRIKKEVGQLQKLLGKNKSKAR